MRNYMPTFIVICLIAGCLDATKVAPTVTQLGVTQDIPRLEFGRTLYIEQCTKCHNALRITRFPLQQWQQEILPDMVVRSKFSNEQTDAVMAYITSVLVQSPQM